MFSDISWGQFLLYLVAACIVYGVTVLLIFYRRNLSKSAANEVVGKTEDAGFTAMAGSVMGKTREEKLQLANGLSTAPATCEACGHVHGSGVHRPRVNSYGVRIDGPTAQTFPSPVLADTSPLVTDFEPVDGAVDLASIMGALEKISTVANTVESGVPAESLVTEKVEAFSFFSNEDLLNSEAAAQLALQLDDAVPTDAYSAVNMLNHLKEAA